MKQQDQLVGRPRKCFDFSRNELLPGKSMLDIGCHNGWLESYLAKAVGENVSFHACELDIEKLRQKEANPSEDIYYTVASALELPYGTSNFDVVTSFDVIEHIPRSTEQLMLREIRRVLKPGGIVLLSTPRKSVLNNLTDCAWYFGHRHYSLPEMQYLLEESGFEFIMHETQGGKYELLLTYILYFCKNILKKDISTYINAKFATQLNSEADLFGGLSLFVKAQKPAT